MQPAYLGDRLFRRVYSKQNVFVSCSFETEQLVVDKSGLTEVGKTGKKSLLFSMERGLQWEGKGHIGGGEGEEQVEALFRRPLLPFCDAHLSVSCPADIDLLMDDLRINVVFR